MNAMRDLIQGLRLMSELNDVIKDTHGNLSVRDGNSFLIKPSGMNYSSIYEEDICIVENNITKSKNERKPSVDLPHHLKIYQNNKNIVSICHTHSPYATAFAIANKDIPCMSTEQSDYFGGAIRCLPYSDLNEWGNFLLKSNEYAILLGNHGCLTFSTKSAVHAVKLAAALENVAMKNFIAWQISSMCNSNNNHLSDDEIKKWHERYSTTYGQ